MRTRFQVLLFFVVFLFVLGLGMNVQGQIKHLKNPSDHGHEAYWSWASAPLEPTTANYFIDSSAGAGMTSEEVERTRDAAETWSGVTPNLDLNEAGSSSNAEIDIKQESIDGSGGTLGQTSNSWFGHGETYPDGTEWHELANVDGGDTIVKMDDDETWNTGTDDPTNSEFDYQTVITHELGHAIGLGHPKNNDNIGAVMDPTISQGEKQRTLTSDDIQATETVYGAIPEPTTWLLFAVGSLVMSLGGRHLRV